MSAVIVLWVVMVPHRKEVRVLYEMFDELVFLCEDYGCSTLDQESDCSNNDPNHHHYEPFVPGIVAMEFTL